MVASMVMYVILAISGLLGSAIAAEDLKQLLSKRSLRETEKEEGKPESKDPLKSCN